MRKHITTLQQVAKNRKRDTETSEMNTKVTLAIESVNDMKRTVENMVYFSETLKYYTLDITHGKYLI